MLISLIVAASANNVIGVQGKLPWRLPADLKRFKEVTTGKPIVMGRRTWDSIGRPLPNRKNIVISRNPGFSAPGCIVVDSPEAAIEAAGSADEMMIIGGGHIYREFLSRADRIYMTRVDVEIDGDAHFPALLEDAWCETDRQSFPIQEGQEYAFDIVTLERLSMTGIEAR
jgi:dihydrofolate reductase